MDNEKVIIAVKNVLEREIQSLKTKVEKNQEFTYLNGRLDTCKWLLNVIKNHEELFDRLGKIDERTNKK